MNQMARRQVTRPRHDGIADLDRPHGIALRLNRRAARRSDRAGASRAETQRTVRGVHDRVDVGIGDIAFDENDAPHLKPDGVQRGDEIGRHGAARFAHDTSHMEKALAKQGDRKPATYRRGFGASTESNAGAARYSLAPRVAVPRFRRTPDRRDRTGNHELAGDRPQETR